MSYADGTPVMGYCDEPREILAKGEVVNSFSEMMRKIDAAQVNCGVAVSIAIHLKFDEVSVELLRIRHQLFAIYERLDAEMKPAKAEPAPVDAGPASG